MSTAPPPNFPSGIPISQQTFENWSQAIKVANLWTCVPASAADVVTVCNWAKGQGYQVRARGIMHTWSPITVTQDQQTVDPKVVLVDTTKSLTGMTLVPASGGQPARVKVGTGATMLAPSSSWRGTYAPWRLRFPPHPGAREPHGWGRARDRRPRHGHPHAAQR